MVYPFSCVPVKFDRSLAVTQVVIIGLYVLLQFLWFLMSAKVIFGENKIVKHETNRIRVNSFTHVWETILSLTFEIFIKKKKKETPTTLYYELINFSFSPPLGTPQPPENSLVSKTWAKQAWIMILSPPTMLCCNLFCFLKAKHYSKKIFQLKITNFFTLFKLFYCHISPQILFNLAQQAGIMHFGRHAFPIQTHLWPHCDLMQCDSPISTNILLMLQLWLNEPTKTSTTDFWSYN